MHRFTITSSIDVLLLERERRRLLPARGRLKQQARPKRRERVGLPPPPQPLDVGLQRLPVRMRACGGRGGMSAMFAEIGDILPN